MKRVLLVSAAVLLAVVAFQRIRHAIASHEQRIEWTIAGMIEGFNGRWAGEVTSGLAEHYRDPATGASREDIADGLKYLWFAQQLRLRAELVEDSLRIAFVEGADPPRADVSLEVEIHLVDELGGDRLWWDLHASGVMVRENGEWLWSETTDVNHGERGRG